LKLKVMQHRPLRNRWDLFLSVKHAIRAYGKRLLVRSQRIEIDQRSLSCILKGFPCGRTIDVQSFERGTVGMKPVLVRFDDHTESELYILDLLCNWHGNTQGCSFPKKVPRLPMDCGEELRERTFIHPRAPLAVIIS